MQTHASPKSPVLIKKMNPHLLISVFLKIGYSIFSFFIHFFKNLSCRSGQNYLFSTVVTLITISFPTPLIRLSIVLHHGNVPSQPSWHSAGSDAQGLFSLQHWQPVLSVPHCALISIASVLQGVLSPMAKQAVGQAGTGSTSLEG